MHRSDFLSAALSALSSFAVPLPERAAYDPMNALRLIEARTGGRLGVQVYDAHTGRTLSYRSLERFPMCSTFKFLAVSAVLSRVDRGQDHQQRRISYEKSDILEYAPVTAKHLSAGFMTLGDLCAAAIEYSDNTAANLILAAIGGPGGVTDYARAIGDSTTRLDRTEPSLNEGIPGDVRDTTSPAAMAADMRRILLGDALSFHSRTLLEGWLRQTTTGDDLIRAGIPHSWGAGDKTGMGGRRNRFGDSDTRNDIAILWPPGKKPIIVAAYLTEATVAGPTRDAALASIGKVVADAFS